MRMSIERMTIDNFKGIRHLSIDFSDTATHIFGMNGSGKTSIPDAFSWVLFNKDSRGNAPGTSNFREKPLGSDGHEIHNLETTVELICTIDGRPFNLKRTQRENWVKKRGAADATYQGNVSTYWVNDVETALKDFKARVAEIAPEEVFRLIGSLSAFNAQNWKERRQQLLAISDTDIDAQLLATDEYRPIADESAQRNISIDDLRKVLLDQRKRTNAELQMIPVRIDEATKALPSITPGEIADAEYIIQDNQRSIETIDGLIAEARASSGQDSIKGQIAALQTEAASLSRAIQTEHASERSAIQHRADSAAQEYFRLCAEIDTDTKRAESIKAEISEKEQRVAQLREDYKAEKSQAFAGETSTVCKLCGQPLLADQIEANAKAAKEAFDQEKALKLKRITDEGKRFSEEAENAKERLNQINQRLSTLSVQRDAADKERTDAADQLAAYPEAPDYSKNPRIAEIEEQIKILMESLSTSPERKIAELTDRKAELNASIERNRAKLAKRDAAEETKRRIAELEVKQRECGNTVAGLERMIALVEKFITDRCAALEESINAHFPTVRWKLFDTQVNGGIADTCTCMIMCNGSPVDYESANTAAQINADIEIINVLSRYYDIYVPLFVDGAESVNALEATKSQLITLSVSTDSELTVREG